MATKKYVSLTKLSTFLTKLRATFAPVNHSHAISDLTDYTVDAALSETSTNPVQNKIINEEFEAIATGMNALDAAIDGKSDSSHTHDDRYYTEDEINTKLSSKADASHTHDDRYYTETEIDSKLAAKSNSTHTHSEYANQNAFSKVVVGSTTIEADTTTDTLTLTAGSNITLTPDASGDKVTIAATDTVYTHPSSGVTAGTYKSVTVNAQGHVTAGTNPTTLAGYGITDADSKGAADAALASAKTYADSAATTAANNVKNELLNGAGAAYDTLKELGDLIDDNTDAIEALETVAASKADASHSHTISDVTDLANATQSTAGLLSAEDKTQLDYGGVPIVTTAGDGSTYTATVDGMTSFVVGMKVTIIPNVTSTTTSPKLNINGLGEKSIRMPITYNNSLTSTGVVDGWLLADKPVTVQWNGTYWVTVDLVRTSAQYLYGAVPIANGGTGATTAEAALTNLGITATATELNYVDGVTSNIQTQLDGKAASDHNHDGEYVGVSDLETFYDTLSADFEDLGSMTVNSITTSGDGAAYTATVSGITDLSAGASFIMVPHTVSTTTMPTLDVNGLGAKYIRRRFSFATGSTTVGSVDYWLTAGKPIRVIYDGTYWLIDVTRPSGSDIYGIVPITSGGTGASTAASARSNFGAVKKISKTITLAAADWTTSSSGDGTTYNSQRVLFTDGDMGDSALEDFSTAIVIVSPSVGSCDTYMACKVQCFSQGIDSSLKQAYIRFKCDDVPTEDLSVNVAIFI